MAPKQRPSFLKRQKEQKRLARAAEKRQARQMKREMGTTQHDESIEPESVAEELAGEEAASEGTDDQT